MSETGEVDRPCATCRHEVDHLIALDIAIGEARRKTRNQPRLRGALNHYLDVAAKVTHRHRKHREDDHLDERRRAITDLAGHLATHAPRSAT